VSDPLASSVATLHGLDLHYVDAGQGPAIVFVHGLLGSHRSWAHLVGELAADHRVLAPDLFGHGASAKPMGDYSLGAHAATLRDLLDHLGIGPVALVGHSLGGGIALQFAYLFPDRVRRLVLVSSGGLGREISVLLRAPTLPGAEWALPLLASRWVRDRGEALGRSLARIGLRAGPDLTEAWRGFASLGDAASRRAFLATARGVIDPGGQTVTARDRLPVLATVPTLLVWGARDRLIPCWHAVTAQQTIPDSRVEVFERAGHFPHLDDPDRFTRVLRAFVAPDAARDRRRPEPAGGRRQAAVGPGDRRGIAQPRGEYTA
jgi:pimeloyl-ACP methyl ester carboxylesterase